MPAQEHPEGSNTAAGASTDGSGEYVRLHITPLDSELFNIIIPASVLPAARNVSYHTIDTFPEKRYGFVELPETHAEKLKKKLNGSVLRGSKIRIEKARPAKQMEPPAPTEMPVKKRKKPADGLEAPKKRKRDVDVVEGVTLRDRKVKRGWTESVEEKKKNKKNKDKESRDKAEKRKRPKSKYTDQEECLLKVKMPPNAMANLPQEAHKKKRKRGNTREVTVHEFEKTTKFPSFLKTSDGNVVEEVKVKAKRTLANAPAAKQKAVEAEQETGSEEDDDDDSTSSSGSSSEEDDDSEVGVPGKNQESTSDLDPKARLKSGSSSEAPSDSGSEDEDDSPRRTGDDREAHPGNAGDFSQDRNPLYKRHKPADDTAEAPSAAEPFSFFSGGNDEDIEEEEEQDHQGDRPAAIPMTPFTKQDFERRNIRSAAPTPDTAHPSRAKNFWAPAEDDEELEDIADGDEDEHAAGPTEKSDFQTWFWENRGDLNRSWMTRRKMASKEKRHRENKARASKAI
ncbi:hypothetical protein ACCO45_009104 [Purpureocillium lilacinum]|uniref:Uncharacterized protein n=1 Tax=Purpureocillium lilacinum TaxID=33203 RepID=A0ACC4DLU6_PURLI